MSIEHLTDDELDRVLCGDGLDHERAAHLAGCVACRRRRDAFVAAVTAAGGEDPDEVLRRTVRAAALATWEAPRRPSVRWRWLAVAAILLVALVLPLWMTQQGPSSGTVVADFDPDAVLSEVDAVLDRDPLTVVASESLVDIVAPLDASAGEGGA